MPEFLTSFLSERIFKSGYIVRTEIWDPDNGDNPVVMKAAYTFDGYYIGSPQDGHYICTKRKIVPEVSKPTNNVCTIGYCMSEGKWYGWSHRAIFGFGVGHVVKKGDVINCKKFPTGFKCKDFKTAKLMAIKFAEEVG